MQTTETETEQATEVTYHCEIWQDGAEEEVDLIADTAEEAIGEGREEAEEWARGGAEAPGRYHAQYRVVARSQAERVECSGCDADAGGYCNGEPWCADCAGDDLHAGPMQRPMVDDVIDEDSVSVTVEEEPACSHPEGHRYASPHWLVGGIKENPGVQGHGGGVIITEACMRCGLRRTTDTWAQDPETGEQGLTEVEYEEGAYSAEIAERRTAEISEG